MLKLKSLLFIALFCLVACNAWAEGLDSNTLLLLHGDGTVDSTTDADFIDSSFSGKTVTQEGNAKLDDEQKKFGVTSLHTLRTGGSYITTPDSDDFTFGADDWTVDTWVYFDTVPGSDGAYIFENRYSTQGGIGLSWRYPNVLYFAARASGAGSDTVIQNTWTPTADTWYHIAVVRDGNDLLMFVDGTQVGTTQTFSITVGNSGHAFNIGTDWSGGTTWTLDGYLDELRVSDVARWTSNFTPPTEAYDDASGDGGINSDTSIMLNGDGTDASTTFTDSSTNNNKGSATVVGDSQLDTSWAKFGTASMLFDGSGDYIYWSDDDDWDVSENFTVDFWIKFANAAAHADSDYMVGQFDDTSNYWSVYRSSDESIRFKLVISGTELVDVRTAASVISDTDEHHIALIRTTGGLWGMYIDGEQEDYVSDTDLGTITSPLYVGTRDPADRYTAGNIDELRIQQSNWFEANPVVGETDTIDVPTEAYSEAELTDAVLWLSFDGADEATPTDIDLSSREHTPTWVATAQIDTDVTDAFGGNAGVLMCDADSDYISFPDSDDWDFYATTDSTFTISLFMKSSGTARSGLFSQVIDGSTFHQMISAANQNAAYLSGSVSSGVEIWADDNASLVYANTGALNDGNWHHVAIVGDNGAVAMYIDGDSKEIATIENTLTMAAVFKIGTYSTFYLDGYIDDFVITTTNYLGADPTDSENTITVPTAAYSEDAAPVQAPGQRQVI